MICARCQKEQPRDAFPFVAKGKQPPDAPRQNVCRVCRQKQHRWFSDSRRYAEKFDAGIVTDRRNGKSGQQQPYHYSLTDRERAQVNLSNRYQHLPDDVLRTITDEAWLDMCEVGR